MTLHLHRVERAAELTPQDVFRRLLDDTPFEATRIEIDGTPVALDIDTAVLRSLRGRTEFSGDEETRLAIALYRALLPAREARPSLLRDPGVWLWLGVEVFRPYVLVRWCGATPQSMVPRSSESCRYFLTGDALVRQTRCALRRLWIAADASFRARGNDGAVAANLALTDLYTAVFERMLGLDAELACALTTRLVGPEHNEEFRRRVVMAVGARLSTVALECLDAGEKAQLVSEAIADMSAHPAALGG